MLRTLVLHAKNYAAVRKMAKGIDNIANDHYITD